MIDLLSNTVVNTIPLIPTSTPRRVVITPDGANAYITNEGIGSVSVLDLATDTAP